MSKTATAVKSLPRMRGDRPIEYRWLDGDRGFTPHARGSTLGRRLRGLEERVYPACAGIDLAMAGLGCRLKRLPRMRGDRPIEYRWLDGDRGFTPHARGSTLGRRLRGLEERVYPACAGIDLAMAGLGCRLKRLPRMRGDRPLFVYSGDCRLWFTPHARGSTTLTQQQRPRAWVYPACAGIDPVRHR